MNKKFLGLGLVAVALLAGAGCQSKTSAPQVPAASQPYNTAPITTEMKTTSTPAIVAPIKKKKAIPVTAAPAVSPTQPAAATVPYSQAVALYGQGARLQFINCHSMPTSLTLKKGLKLMLDNRDGQKHSVKVGAQAYTLGAYGYLVVTANSVGNNIVTCDGGGVGLVAVQP